MVSNLLSSSQRITTSRSHQHICVPVFHIAERLLTWGTFNRSLSLLSSGTRICSTSTDSSSFKGAYQHTSCLLPTLPETSVQISHPSLAITILQQHFVCLTHTLLQTPQKVITADLAEIPMNINILLSITKWLKLHAQLHQSASTCLKGLTIEH